MKKFFQQIHTARTQGILGGFTLVETLVAISILSISILATFTAVQNGLQTSQFARDQTTAFYFVQDAMEGLRNVRDTNAILSLDSVSTAGPAVNWLSGISATCSYPNTCYIDTTTSSPSLTVCGASCPVLRQSSSSGKFGYNPTWSDTVFTRSIQISQPGSNPDEIMVTITIGWQSGHFGNKTFQVKQLLYNVN